MYQKLQFKIVGISPLIQHNGQTSDPLNQFSKMLKEVTGKRSKTDADHAEIRRIQWYAGLYLNDGKIVIPAQVMEAALCVAARKLKLGLSAKAGLFIDDHAIFYFDGDDLTVDELWNRDQNRLTVSVVIDRKRVMTTRPIFKDWSAEFTIIYDEDLFNGTQVQQIVKICGDVIGLCDWRPKFGRFQVVV
jgi:hypothetical protein